MSYTAEASDEEGNVNRAQNYWKHEVDAMKVRVRTAEDILVMARKDLRVAEDRLQEAIDADRESWHDTPGILK